MRMPKKEQNIALGGTFLERGLRSPPPPKDSLHFQTAAIVDLANIRGFFFQEIGHRTFQLL